jgi:cell division protein FtsQ
VLQAYRLVSAQFEKLDMPMERLELSGQGGWRASFEGGAVIELGHGSISEIESRTQRFIATLSQVSTRFGRDLESADLRYSNGYALRLKGVTTLNPGDKEDQKVKR